MKSPFPKSNRLLKRTGFTSLRKKGKCHAGEWIRMEVSPNDLEQTRLGITVTTRFGKAHERNRFKRVVREAFRTCYSHLKKGFDLNVRPRRQAHQATVSNIQEDLLKVLEKK